MAEQRPLRRPGFARGRWGFLIVVTVVVLVYALTLLLYWRSTQPPDADSRPTPPDSELEGRVQVGIDINALTPADSTATAQLKAEVPNELRDEESELVDKLVIEVVALEVDSTASRRAAAYDTVTVTFDKGTRLLAAPIKLVVPGEYATYPLDRYQTNVIVLASSVSETEKRKDLPVVIAVGGEIPGWRVLSGPIELAPSVDLDGSADPLPEALVTLRRSGSTMAITGLILIAIVVLVIAALLVARAVWVKKRRIEATMASWFAALMFAVIPLRTNLPGSPPMGVWIDFLVVLWVEVGLMIALAIFIGSWLSYTPRPDYAPELVTAAEPAADAEAAEPAADAEAAEPAE